jgi:hypothetical protein
MQILETAAVAAAAIVTRPSALVAQTFVAGSDIAVQVFAKPSSGLEPQAVLATVDGCRELL